MIAAVDTAARAIVEARHGDPFAVLGMHAEGGALVVRAFLPRAERISVIDIRTGAESRPLERVDPAGFFVGAVGRGDPFPYRLRVRRAGTVVDIEDPYRFGPVLGEVDAYLIAEGTHRRLYDILGAHPCAMEHVAGVAFAVWAPNASRVAVVGDFNGWDGRMHPMRFRRECGVWELFVPGAAEGQRYKYEIKGPGWKLLPLHADPFAFSSEHPPATASIVTHLAPYEGPPAGTARSSDRHAPMSIYEVHLGSWRRRPDEGNRYLSYRELAEELIPYAKWMGFTHLELMPVAEYPFDGSWGYQPIGLYAPTSRFGSPEDFRTFVARAHAEGLGVIIDWVPGHFPTDGHGLGYFDGTHLYEHADPRQGFHPDWNTYVYNHGRSEVADFLECNALYWLREFGIDGLRVDAVASMLYLDYSRRPGEWIPNQYGGNENLGAIAFLRRVNELVYDEFPGAVTAAEESTAWPMVSRPTSVGGLGFGYKWNMGWMHDTLAFMSTDPLYRRYHMQELTFGLLYAWSENYILPISHDEVVHGKGSLLGKMPGDAWQRFANVRALYGFMYGYPGKKLLFMGTEFAQEHEWNHDTGLDWAAAATPSHGGVMTLVRDLNVLYAASPALHELDCESAGFEWIDHTDHDASVIAFARFARDRERLCVVVCNFTPVLRTAYRIGVPGPGWYREACNTDSQFYGGSNAGNDGGVRAEAIPAHGREWSILLTLPGLSTMIFERA